MRHDAGACSEGIREFDKSVIWTHIHTAVRSELVESQCNGSDCGCDGPFCLSTAQLGGNAVVIQTGEAQKVGCHLPVQRERTAISGSGTERILVSYVVRSAKHVHVVGKSLGVGPQP